MLIVELGCAKEVPIESVNMDDQDTELWAHLQALGGLDEL